MYQFIHIEDYSINTSKKKRADQKEKIRIYNNEVEASDKKETNNVRGIIAEAKREPGNIPMSVQEIGEPVLLYGVDLDTVEVLAAEYHQKTKIKDKNGKEKKLRNDANVLIAGVISLNAECIDFWDDYKKKSIDYLKEKYGDRLKSVVEHTDEPNPHFHFYVIPEIGERFELIHDGRKAMLENKDKVKRMQNRAYKQAMRDFQEDFYSKVSFEFGLMKNGPKLKRQSKRSYHDQQREIKLLNKLKKEAEEQIKSLNQKVTLEKEKAFKLGFNRGIKKAVDDFNAKNYFNKFIFSVSFSQQKIKKHDETINKNKELKNKILLIQDRKNYYKNKYNKVLNENNNLKKENENFNKINDFLNFDLNKTPEENENVRRKLIEQINIVERQQQQIDHGIKESDFKQSQNRKRFARTRGRIERIRQSLYFNIRDVVRDIFTFELFKRKFKEEEIEKPKNNISEQKPSETRERKNTIRRSLRM